MYCIHALDLRFVICYHKMLGKEKEVTEFIGICTSLTVGMFVPISLASHYILPHF